MSTSTSKTKRVPSAAKSSVKHSGNEHHSDNYFTTKMVDALGQKLGDLKDAKVVTDFPFDLNNLFSLQYSFDTLKQAIQYLAD
jgi:hypothetical protein